MEHIVNLVNGFFDHRFLINLVFAGTIILTGFLTFRRKR